MVNSLGEPPNNEIAAPITISVLGDLKKEKIISKIIIFKVFFPLILHLVQDFIRA